MNGIFSIRQFHDTDWERNCLSAGKTYLMSVANTRDIKGPSFENGQSLGQSTVLYFHGRWPSEASPTPPFHRCRDANTPVHKIGWYTFVSARRDMPRSYGPTLPRQVNTTRPLLSWIIHSFSFFSSYGTVFSLPCLWRGAFYSRSACFLS